MKNNLARAPDPSRYILSPQRSTFWDREEQLLCVWQDVTQRLGRPAGVQKEKKNSEAGEKCFFKFLLKLQY